MLAPDGDPGLLDRIAPQSRKIDLRGYEALFDEPSEEIFSNHADEADPRGQTRQNKRRNSARSAECQSTALDELLFLKPQLRNPVDQQIDIRFPCHNAVEIRHVFAPPAP